MLSARQEPPRDSVKQGLDPLRPPRMITLLDDDADLAQQTLSSPLEAENKVRGIDGAQSNR